MDSNLRSNKMRNTPIGKLLLTMSLPAIISMFVQALYNIVDSMFVANMPGTITTQYNGVNIGGDSFTAITIAYPLTMICVAIGVGLGVGANVYISRKLGEGNHEKANKTAKNAIVLAVIMWAIIAVVGFFIAEPFTNLFINPNEVSDATYVREQCVLYLRIFLIGSLGQMVDHVLNRMLQATGNMKVPMISQLIGAISNIILDALFILVFRWGVTGAVVATIIGQILAASFTLSMYIFKKQDIDISFKGYRPENEYFGRILKTGLPTCVMNSVTSFVTMILNIYLQKGTGMDILGCYTRIQSFIFMPIFGLMQGLLPILSYNYGANLKHRFNQALTRAIIVSVCVMAFGTLIFQLLPSQLLSIFIDVDKKPNTITDGIPAFRIISISFVFAAFGITLSNLLQSFNCPTLSLFMSLTRQVILLVPIAILFFDIWGQLGLWWCFPLSEAITVFIFLPTAYHFYKKQFAYKQKQYDEGKI